MNTLLNELIAYYDWLLILQLKLDSLRLSHLMTYLYCILSKDECKS